MYKNVVATGSAGPGRPAARLTQTIFFPGAGHVYPHLDPTPAECPVRWAKAGILLPGFDASGTRDPTAWRRSNEPIKETIRAWIALIKDGSNWTVAVPSKAGIPNAPGLANFEAQLLRAPDKP